MFATDCRCSFPRGERKHRGSKQGCRQGKRPWPQPPHHLSGRTGGRPAPLPHVDSWGGRERERPAMRAWTHSQGQSSRPSSSCRRGRRSGSACRWRTHTSRAAASPLPARCTRGRRRSSADAVRLRPGSGPTPAPVRPRHRQARPPTCRSEAWHTWARARSDREGHTNGGAGAES